MIKEKVKIGNLKLIGLTTRTTNKNEFDPSTAKIGSIVNSYWEQQVASQFRHRVNPGTTFMGYTDYESDENGEYTFFIGEEIKSIADQDMSKFMQLTIPAGYYQKFTTNEGKMPDIVIELWQKIWQMTEVDFGGKRKYQTDFQIHDQRTMDPNNSTVDIYIGLVDE